MEGIIRVTVKEVKNLYTKNLELANSIELYSFEELDYQVVNTKGKYNIGDKCLFIMPDYCIPENEYFIEYIKPQGDYSKSKLGKIEGKPTRVKAISFNMTKNKDLFKKIFSNGIILDAKLFNGLSDEEIEKELGVYKYIQKEDIGNLNWVENLYKTDELNIKLYPKLIDFNKEYYISRKVDGSSITILKSDNYKEGFIGSRRIGQIIDKSNSSNFVIYGLPILEKLLKSEYNNIALRGELYGKASSGSGNKNNSDSKKEANIKFFSVDKLDGVTNQAEVVSYKDFIDITDSLGLDRVDVIEENVKFETLEDLYKKGEEIFEYYKENEGILIEGIVVRSMDSTISFKYMNEEYDSKK